MHTRRTYHKSLRTLSLHLFAAVALIGTAAAQNKPGAPTGAPPPEAAAAPVAAPEKAEYVGSDTCQACHEDIFNAFVKSPHHTVEINEKRGFKGKGCESCHSMGSLHAGSGDASLIRNPAKLTAAAANQTCLKCHLNQPTHVGRLESAHANNSVACVSCHKIHANGPNGLVVRKPVQINAQ